MHNVPVLQADEVLVFYLAKNKQNMMVEENFDNLTAADIRENWPAVEAAVRKELASFHEMHTFEFVLRSLVENICSSRWVMKFKLVDGIRVIKARLTIRGYEDMSVDASNYAGTCSRWGQRLINSVCVQRNWPLFIADVSTAFLQGLSFAELAELQGGEAREVAFTMPPGYEQYIKANLA
jgi:hypothetical protein